MSDRTVLAYLLAHELAHQLLRTPVHANRGLMAASLGAMDWYRAEKGRLWFSEGEAAGLRAGAASRATAMVNARSGR